MRIRFLPHVLAAVLCSLAATAHAQVVPSARESGGWPISVGAGLGSFNPNFDNGRMMAGTLWIDFKVPLPQWLQGLGLEIEGGDIAFDRNSAQAHNKEEEVAGGLTYGRWKYHQFRPYVKALRGFGNGDFPTARSYYHETRTVTSIGGGFVYPILDAISLRAEYEYQYWPRFWFNPRVNGASLDPNGFTIGAIYKIGPWHRY